MESTEGIFLGVIAAAAGVLGAVLGGIFSYFTMRSQHRAVVRSENRQQWINTLRDTIAEIQAIAVVLWTQRQVPGGDVTPIAERSERLWFHVQKLELLLNPNEADHRALIEAVQLHVVARIVAPEQRQGVSIPDPHDSAAEITGIAQRVLKREWERVKKGV